MELTQKDRLILINQYQILQRLDPDSAPEYGRAIEILQKGYAQLYPELAADLEESELCEDKAALVQDIAAAYQALAAYQAANPGDREVADHPWVNFRGFDAATEAEYLAFAQFLLGDEAGDSEAPALPKYRMVALTWAGQGKPAELTRDIALAMLGLGSGISADEEPAALAAAESDTPAEEDDDTESEAAEETGSETGEEAEAPAAPARGRKRASK